MSIKQIDNGLGLYYQSRNVTNYYDDEGYGRFRLWADDNGMEIDDIREDLADDEPMLTEFDENFPLDDTGKQNNRPKQIRDIILKCLKEQNPFFGKVLQFPDITKSFFDINPKEMLQMKQQYTNQCASVMNQGMSDDNGLFQIITAGHINGCDEYLQHLVDTYSRDSIAYYLQYKDSTEYVTTLDIDTWSHLDNSPLFKTFNEFESTLGAVTKTKAAIASFYGRLVPKLILTGNKKIVDSVEDTAAYITSAVLFVNDLKSQSQTFPFQIDFSIGYRSAREQDDMPHDSEDDAEPYDEDDDDEEEEQKHDTAQEFIDCIGNVRQKL
eukprot:1064458_1